ncbi:CaiB/BaiF CoA transferase family protein [Colwellia sp. MEBiC06753]
MSNLLEGIKVIELCSMAAGPSAGVILSDFGADVIKIEPLTGDPWRYGHLIPPMPASEVDYCNLFANRNKKSVALDMKNEDARNAFYKLVESADILTSNCLPYVAKSLDVEYEKIKQINPRIVYAQMTGYGECGPEANAPGFDATSFYSRSGLQEALRAKNGQPVPIPVGMGDMSTATAFFAAIMSGLYQRERTGEGCKVSTSLLENGVWSNGISIQAELVGAKTMPKFANNEWPQPTLNAIYQSKDDRFIVISHMNDAALDGMYKIIGAPHLVGDVRFKDKVSRFKNSQVLLKEIQGALINYNLDEIVELLTKARISHSIVKHNNELPDDPQANAIGLWQDVEGMPGIRTVASPINIEGIEKVKPKPGPKAVGRDTIAELKRIGITDEQIQAMVDSKAIGIGK